MIPEGKKSIAHLFNKFAGKEISVTESHHEIDIGGKKYPITEVNPDPNDSTLRQMHKVAKAHGLSLRVFFPGWGGTCDYRIDRMNAHVEKGADGKYRVTNNFGIG